ncbi:TPA: hypothetical protein QDB07_000851 [Burkholderia vietnamiensis]|nr:hypothetical protein [Burkholderia vietnamiensis]
MSTTTTRKPVFPRPAATVAPTARKTMKGHARAVPVTPIEPTAVEAIGFKRPAHRLPVVDWPSLQQAMPNAVARSALFTCTRPEKAKQDETVDEYAPRIVDVVVEKRIPSMPQHKVVYHGAILNQADAEVWQMALLDAREAGKMGTPVTFSLNNWCRTLDRTENDPRTNKAIIESMTRLQAAILIVEDHGEGTECRVSLIEHFCRDTKTGRCTYAIHPGIADLLRHDSTSVDLWRKARLRGSIAKWLHDFYSTHSDPIPMTIEALHTMSGSNTPMRNFRIRVREAIDELQNCEPPLFAKGTRIENDRLHVIKATNSYFEAPQMVKVQQQPAANDEPDTRAVSSERVSAAVQAARTARTRVAL